MSTRGRKERKVAGIPFSKPQKVPTGHRGRGSANLMLDAHTVVAAIESARELWGSLSRGAHFPRS